MQSAGGARPSSPEAHAFSAMIDERLPGHRPKYPLEPISERAASAAAPAQLEAVMKDAGFGAVDVQTVTQTIAFPSVVDYVRFQLLATPMTALLRDKAEPDRQAVISTVASKTMALAMPAILDDGRFTFPQGHMSPSHGNPADHYFCPQSSRRDFQHPYCAHRARHWPRQHS
jgi:hypothetical protein